MKEGVAVFYSIAIGITLVSACSKPCPRGTHCTEDGLHCNACPDDTFNNKETNATECSQCRVACGQKEDMKMPCTTTEDMLCECVAGFYKNKQPTPYGTCLPFRKCPAGEGVKNPGTPWNNTECQPCEDGKFSQDESAIQICNPCTSCPNGEEVERKCTPSKDTLCRIKGKGMSGAVIAVIVILCIAVVCVLILLILYRKGKLPCFYRHGTDETKDEIKFKPVNGNHESPDAKARNGSPLQAENGSVPQRAGVHGATGLRVDLSQGQGQSDGRPKVDLCHGQGQSDGRPVSLQHQNSSDEASSLAQLRRDENAIPHSSSTSNQRNPQVVSYNRHDSGGSATGYSLQRAFTDLSKDLCSVQWEMFFRRLIGEGSDAILAKVKRNFHYDVREQIYQMFKEWERIESDKATMEAILKELEDMEESLLVSRYREKLS